MAEPAGKPTRRWFQFHLSTAVVVMIVAGVLIWMNLRDIGSYSEERQTNSAFALLWHNYSERYCGWPYCWHSRNSLMDPFHIIWTPFIIDSLIIIGIVIVIASALEYLIRRREAHKS